ARLTLTAARAGEVVTAKAAVANLAKPGPKVRLRMALVESVVRYRGGNGIAYHHCVVRGFFGSPEGVALPGAAAGQEFTLNLESLRQQLAGHLDQFQKANEGVTFAERPLRLKELRVVAFVQDDATHEVIQAVQAEVK